MTDRPIPRATYRLQLTRDFGFADVERLAPYLARLGISHAYLSPILKARPGSTHGYDTVDHTVLNPELGTIEDFRRMAGALRRHGLGIVLDIVPNHMGIGGDANALWLDVLEWGQASPYAGWFDIDWEPSEPTLHGRVLVPFLGRPFGESLASGKLDLRFDATTGSFAVWAEGAHKLPLSPPTFARVFGNASEQLSHLGEGFANAAEPADGAVLKQRLAELCRTVPGLVGQIDERIAALNGEAERSELAGIIAAQHWRAARYSVAADDINYRRFFIVSDLAAIRVEREDVFAHVHRLVFDLVAERLVDGLRVDHVDGLYDPAAYCRRLRERAPRPIYLLVEKILGPHERLPRDWDTDGTTGYEFATHVTRLLVDPAAEGAMTRVHAEIVGGSARLADIEIDAKLAIIDEEMAAELGSLARRLRRLAAQDVTTQDLTLNALRSGLRQVVAAMPVYRSYVADGPVDARGRRDIAVAVARARRRAPGLDPAVLDFIADTMTGDLSRPGTGYVPEEALDAARRIQQFTAPVMAKGLEDTALYRYNRLISLSDVGELPDRFGESVASFHDFCRGRRHHLPDGMLTTSSHDTKRGEDTRARIAAIAAHPDRWQEAAEGWVRALGDAARALDPDDVYFFLQLLVGAWPAGWPDEGPLDAAELDAFRARMDAAMLKSVREARRHTSWTRPDADYEQAVARLVGVALEAGGPFLSTFRAFARDLGPAGAANGLIVATLKLTVPGVPDIYQGAELWEQSMVDPDNRRPVDFAQRAAILARVEGGGVGGLMAEWPTGAVKLALVSALLRLRADRPQLFARGSYEPLAVTGPGAERVVAFARRHEGRSLVVVAALDGDTADAAVVGLPAVGAGQWRDCLEGKVVDLPPEAAVAGLRGALPVAVLLAGPR